jgi:lipocalin
MKRINFITIFACLFTSCSTLQKVNNETVESFDLNRYLGTWYEIARFNHIFERGMDHNEALYTICEDGTIRVINSAIKNGEPKRVTGIAKTTNTPALLRVSFFRPFYADYRVLYIDVDYQYALVGSASANYLWILSRTPEISDSAKDTLLTEAICRGYDTSKFIWVRQ